MRQVVAFRIAVNDEMIEGAPHRAGSWRAGKGPAHRNRRRPRSIAAGLDRLSAFVARRWQELSRVQVSRNSAQIISPE